MGNQQPASISSYNQQPYTQNTQQNPLQRVGTIEEINKNAMNVMKSYSNKSSNVPRSSTMVERPKFKYNISLQNLKETFKAFAIDGTYLNKDRFNDSIESLFRFPLPEMHYTYLSEKIYELLDDSNDGKIQEDEFLQGLTNVLSNKDFRIKLSMMAMMSLADKNRMYIEANEIKDFFFKSWIQGYKHLGWQIKKDKNDFMNRKLPLATSRQLEIWALRYENQIKQSIDADLRDNGIDPSRNIDLETFKRWIYLDHTLYITYAHKSIMIATNLVRLDEVGFDENGKSQVQNMMPGMNQGGQGNNKQPFYPNFG